MLKKILTILTTALCCVSCTENTFREKDVFIIKSVEINEQIKKERNYNYKYYLHWLQKYHGCDKFFVEEMYYYSDEEYKLGDTLSLFNKK